MLFKWGVRLLYVSLLVFLSIFILRNLNAMREFELQPRIMPMLAALFLILTSYLANCWLWQRFAEIYGIRSDFITAGKAWSQSQLGKYIPGKVSVFLFRMNVYPAVLKSRVAVASAYEYITNQAASCIIILLSISLAPLALPEYLRGFAIAGIICSLVVLTPAFFIPVSNKLFTLLRQSRLEEAPGYTTMLLFIGAYIVSLFVQSAGLYFVIRAFTELSIWHLISITGMYQAAALAGIFAIFTPAGLGVREGVLVLIVPLLAISEPVVIVSVITMRLLTIGAELILAGCFTGLSSLTNPVSKQQ